MPADTAIKVENLSKIYKLYNTHMDRLKESLHPLRRKYHHDFHALNDVSFELKKGETLGIIGKNGSGKSTLLKLITGVLTPTSGTITVNGRISALLELGSGFNQELTGIENVYFNGTLMGYSREEMDNRLDKILAFADIGEFVYQPVKAYSSGMFVRLAFAVAVNVEPDILIVDEALAVGDIRFQKKCKERMNDFKDSGCTIIIVSHAMSDIRTMCNSGIYLEKGSLVQWGDVSEVINKFYEKESEDDKVEFDKLTRDKMPSTYSGDIAGTGDIILRNIVCYQKGAGNCLPEIEFGKPIIIECDYEVFGEIKHPIITVNIGCAFYRVIANMSSLNHNFRSEEVYGSGKFKVEVPNQQFYPGTYVIHIGISTEKVNVHYYLQNNAICFRIIPPKDTLLCYPGALVQPDAIFSIEATNV